MSTPGDVPPADADEPVVLRTDQRSGFPVLSIGRRVTSDDVAAALDEERCGTCSTRAS